MKKTVETITYDFDGDLFIDIGANRGLWTTELYDCYRKILFVEPSSIIQHAMATVKDPEKKITYYKYIVSHRAGQYKSLYSPHDETANLGVYNKELYGERLGITLAEENIETTCINAFMPLASPGDKILIKIDTEGSELDIMLGAMEFIQKLRPLIMMETHFHMYYDQAKYEFMIDTLSRWGYKITEYKNMALRGSHLEDGVHTGDQMRDLHYMLVMEPT